MVLTPPNTGGQNHKNRDCGWTQRPVASLLWGYNQVGIYIVVTPLPRRRVCVLRVGGHGGVSSPLLLLNLVRSFAMFEILPTHI